MKLKVFTDGASRGNPGDASYGYVIKVEDGAILHQEGRELGVTTNNVAEYTAVLEAFSYIASRWGEKTDLRVELNADSKLVIEQLAGRYKLKSPHLREIFVRIRKVEERISFITYKHIPREENFLADRLANQALDKEL